MTLRRPDCRPDKGVDPPDEMAYRIASRPLPILDITAISKGIIPRGCFRIPSIGRVYAIVTVHEPRVTSVQRCMERRKYLPGASVDQTEARNPTARSAGTRTRFVAGRPRAAAGPS